MCAAFPEAVSALRGKIVEFCKGPEVSARFEAVAIDHGPCVTKLYHFNRQNVATVSVVEMDGGGVRLSTETHHAGSRLKIEIYFTPSESAPAEHGSFKAVICNVKDETLVERRQEYANGFIPVIKTYVRRVETPSGLRAVQNAAAEK